MRTTTAAFALAATLTLAACSTSGSVSNGSTAGVNHPDGASSSAAQSSAAPANPAFGQTYTFDDGLAVTVSAPAPFTASDTAFVAQQPAPSAFVAFDVTVVNGTQENYDPNLFTTSLQSANQEMEEVFDSAAGINGSPSTPVLPGRETTFKVVYGVVDPADLVMQVAPGFEYDPAIFTS